MYYILARCPYYKENEEDKEKTGIKRLINNGTYTAAFPLHDVRLLEHTAQEIHKYQMTFLTGIKQQSDFKAVGKMLTQLQTVKTLLIFFLIHTGAAQVMQLQPLL